MKTFTIALLAAATAVLAADVPNPPTTSDILRTYNPLTARQTTGDACNDGEHACAVGGTRWVCGGGRWIYAETCNAEECCDPIPDGSGLYCSCGGHP